MLHDAKLTIIMENSITSPKNKMEGKVAVITGGASGIGKATALLFAANGARAVVIADIQDELGQKLVETIGPHRATYVNCNVTDENQVKALIDRTVELYGSVDVMFCNAGIATSSSLQTVLEFDLEAYEKLISVNVRGVVLGMKHAGRAMVEKGTKGSIICTASVAGGVGWERSTDYTMSKWAVLGLMKSASIQLAGHEIRVNSVSPGWVATPMACNALRMEPEEFEKAFEGTSRLPGVTQVKHVADAVLFLASEASEFITGHNLVVDGGFKGF